MYECSKRMPMLHQISSGLQVFGILDSIKEHPQLLEPVFTESSFFKPNADTFIDNIVGSFREDGSNDKLIEIDVFKYFTDFIEECECSNQEVLAKLFKFITGTSLIPPLGLPKGITVKFRHGCSAECKCRATTSTCDLSITFPVHYSGPEEFKKYLDSALVEGIGFGFSCFNHNFKFS